MVLLLLKFALATVLIYALAQYDIIDFGAFADLALDESTIAIVLFLMIFFIFLTAGRLWFLLRFQMVEVSFRQAVSLTFVGAFGNTFLPGTFGGDMLKVAFLLKIVDRDRARAFGALAVDRLVGLIGIVVIFVLAGAIIHDQLPPALFGIVKIGAGILVAFFVSLVALLPCRRKILSSLKNNTERQSSRVKAFCLRFCEAVFESLNMPLVSIVSLVFSVCIYSISALAVYILGKTFGAPGLSPLVSGFLTCFSFLASLIPVTPGGLGLGEAAFGKTANSIGEMSAVYSYGTVFLAFRILMALSTVPGLFILFGTKSVSWTNFRRN